MSSILSKSKGGSKLEPVKKQGDPHKRLIDKIPKEGIHKDKELIAKGDIMNMSNSSFKKTMKSEKIQINCDKSETERGISANTSMTSMDRETTTIKQTNSAINTNISQDKNDTNINTNMNTTTMSKSIFKFDLEDDNTPLGDFELKFNNIARNQLSIEFHQVNDLLKSIGMEKYLDVFIQNGIDDIDKIKQSM